MLMTRRAWQEELDIVDRTLREISSVADPEQLINTYWNGIGKLIPANDYIALSRRDVERPKYLITRSSRMKQSLNPWTQRDRLPLLAGGVLGEIIYANRPVIIDDLPSRLSHDDPAYEFLEGFGSLVGLPQYDSGESLNATVMMFPPGRELDPTLIPILHWQAGLFGRGATNLVLRNKLEVALRDLDRELRGVGEIQRSLLPRQLPQIGGFDIATYYLTSRDAGGDYYDFFPLDGGAWGVLIADVTGHGTPAAVMMAIVGGLHIIAGIAALIEDQFFVIGREYVYEFDVTTWGWIHLIAGIVVFVASFGLFTGRLWARTVGVLVAAASLILNFMYLPYYPVWSVVMIAVAILVIWALTFHGRDIARESW